MEPAPLPSARGDGKPRRRRGEAQRQAILTEAVRHLAAHGFRGTSIAALAAECGTTHSNLLYYFGSKRRLLHEVVTERERVEESDYLRRRAAERDGLAGLSWLRYVVRQNVEHALLSRLYVVLAAENLDPDDDLHAFFVTRYARARALVAAAYRADVAHGRARPEVDADALSAEVISVLMGAETQWLMDPDGVDLVAVVDRYLETLQDRLAADRPVAAHTEVRENSR